MTDQPLYAGLDLGTSGARVVAIDEHGGIVASARSLHAEHGSNHRDAAVWWHAASAAIRMLGESISLSRLQAIAVDATSGTVLAIDGNGVPVADALMYNDAIDDTNILRAIAQHAPAQSAVHGASSGLARAITLQQTDGCKRILHQADWIAGCLSAEFQISDESNALKTGYDPINRCWPDWLADTGLNVRQLPQVLPAGTPSGIISAHCARQFGLPEQLKIVTGVSDGCASFLATGAASIGDCVTALGSTITMKMLCDQPIFSPQYGIYSHRIGDRWLAGGASNSGGAVLANFFNADELLRLSKEIDTAVSTGLQLYPLLQAGERFPHNDANWQPLLQPRPDNDSIFLQAMLEGMAAIEALGYQRLTELGAPTPVTMRSVGGGAANQQWAAIRQHELPDIQFLASDSTEAATGAARLALAGARQ